MYAVCAVPQDFGVFVVRLRDGSAEEARATAEMAADLGVTHHVLPIDWEGSPPGRYKMQKRSREKRYLALLEHCNASSIAHLMTAHHIDDQIGKL